MADETVGATLGAMCVPSPSVRGLGGIGCPEEGRGGGALRREPPREEKEERNRGGWSRVDHIFIIYPVGPCETVNFDSAVSRTRVLQTGGKPCHIG